MTSRMEFRNYRSSAQLVHCNIHRKRYSDVPVFVSYFKISISTPYDLSREGQGTQSTWESSPFRSEMFHPLNEESSLLNKIRFLKRYLNLLHLGNKVVFPIFNLSVEPVKRGDDNSMSFAEYYK